MIETAIQHCRTYALWAERRMGEMLAQTNEKRAKGTMGLGRPKKGCARAVQPNPDEPTLTSLGVSRKEASAAQKLAAISESEFREVLAGQK